MTTTARGHRFRNAAAIQSAEGTANTTTTNMWEYSYTDGGLESILDEAELATTDTDDAATGFYIRSAMGGGDLTMVLDPTSGPFWWKTHLGSENVVGSVHTITKTDLPIFTTNHFMRPDVIGGTDRWSQFVDSFTKTVELQHKAGELLLQKVELAAKKEIFNTTAAVPTASPAAGLAGDYRVRGTTITAPGPLLTCNGSTLLFDFDATPAATTIRNPESITITSSFPNFKWLQTDTLNPSYYDKGEYKLTITLSLLFDSFAGYANTCFGTKTITSDMAQSATVKTGAADFTWPVVAGTASRSLQLQAQNMRWKFAPAKIQPSGDAIRVTVTGAVVASATDITVVGTGTRATTAYTNSA